MSVDVHLRAILGAFALDAAFTAPDRGITALFGPSGAGKTSLLRGIAGLSREFRGHVNVNGERWQDDHPARFIPPHRRAVGYVFQEASLFPHLSVRANLEYGWHRIAASRRRIALEQIVEWLGLATLLTRKPEYLSGGERQRVAIGRALLASPSLLLLDEPLAALDAAAKMEIIPYLDRLHRELAIPALYVSHSPEEVARLCDYLVLIEHGRVREQGDLPALLTRLDLPIAHGDAAGAIIDATVAERDEAFALSSLAFDGGQLAVTGITSTVGSRVRVRILARDVSVALEPPRASSILNVLPARLLAIAEDTAGSVMLRLGVGNSVILARISRKSAAVLELTNGKSVYAQIKGVALLK